MTMETRGTLYVNEIRGCGNDQNTKGTVVIATNRTVVTYCVIFHV